MDTFGAGKKLDFNNTENSYSFMDTLDAEKRDKTA